MIRYSTILLIIISFIARAQDEKGIIYGKVADAVTNEPLIGVNIILEGTTLGAATDRNGHYEIGHHFGIFIIIHGKIHDN